MASLALTQAKREMVAIGELSEQSDLDWTKVRFMAPNDKPAIDAMKATYFSNPNPWWRSISGMSS